MSSYKDEISESDEDLRPLNQDTLQLDDDFQSSVIQARDNDIVGIHSQIVQVNDLFKDLQKLVLESSETVDNIQMGVINASHDVSQGTEELKEAANQQKGVTNRNCIIAICVVFFAVCVVAGVVLYVKLKPQQ